MGKFAGIVSGSFIHLEQELQRMLTAMSLPKPLEKPSILKIENVIIGATGSHFFSNSTKTLYIGIDGFILNLQEVKQELERAGQVITSDKEEDILILSYLTWGQHAFRYFSGPFVITVFDVKQKKITIARDRLGTRSLFWGKVGPNVLFSTHLKGVLCSSLIAQTPDLSSITSYFFLGYFPQDKTPIRNINRLHPGHFLEINQDGDISINKYWSFKDIDRDHLKLSQEEVNEKTAYYLKNAVQKRLNFSSNVACLLTSDLGSTSIAHYLKSLHSNKIKSFSFDFDGTKRLTANYTQRDASHYGFEHQNHLTTPDNIFDNLQHIIWHLDEPIADPNAAGIWKAAQWAQQNSCDIFSALGSLELLGGQLGHGEIPYEPLYLWFLYLTKPIFLKAIIPGISSINKKTSLNMLRFFQRDFWAYEYVQQQSLFSLRSLKKVAPALDGLFDVHLFLQQSYQYLKFILSQNFSIEDYLFFDAETSLSNRLLFQYEKLFESFNVNFFSPFFDRDFVDYMLQIPESFKFKGKKFGTPLYDLLQKDFKAEELLNFQDRNPWFLSNWMNHPKVKSIFNMLPKGVLVESNIINGENLKKVLDKGVWKYHQFERLWAILVLEIWFHLFVNNPIYSYPEEGQSLEDFLKIQQPFLQ